MDFGNLDSYHIIVSSRLKEINGKQLVSEMLLYILSFGGVSSIFILTLQVGIQIICRQVGLIWELVISLHSFKLQKVTILNDTGRRSIAGREQNACYPESLPIS